MREIELPLSGVHAVTTDRSGRQTLEVFDDEGRLLGVVSDSTLDPAVLRGAWRGTHAGRPWALVVGRTQRAQAPAPIAVTFSTGRPMHRRRIDVAATGCGDFWLAEVASAATRVSVTVGGAAAGQSSVQLVA